MSAGDGRGSRGQQRSHRLFGPHREARLVAGGMLVPVLDRIGPAGGGAVRDSCAAAFNPSRCLAP